MLRKILLSILFLSKLCFIEEQSLKGNKNEKTFFNSIHIDTLFQDKISIRAILIDDSKIWYAGDKGRFGFYDLKTNKKTEKVIVKDTLKIEFRSIAKTSKCIYVLNVANPALLYQIKKD